MHLYVMAKYFFLTDFDGVLFVWNAGSPPMWVFSELVLNFLPCSSFLPRYWFPHVLSTSVSPSFSSAFPMQFHSLWFCRLSFLKYFRTVVLFGYGEALLVKSLRYKPRGRGFYSRWDYLCLTMALGSTQSLTEMSARVISWWIKVAGA